MNVISPASVGLHRWKILQSKGKNRQCAEQQVEGREGQGIEIRFAEMFSPVTITNMGNGWQRREMLEKMQRNTCERLPCPGLSSLQVEKIPHEAV